MPDRAVHPAVPSATSNTRKAFEQARALAESWPAAEVASALFQLHALGAREVDARRILDALAYRGVRRVGPYVAKFNSRDVHQWTAEQRRADASPHQVAQRAAGAYPSGKWFMRARQRSTLPWRTSSNQERGERYA